ncbi:helix-turn-helix domain-containing protein [Fictibacillus phosphorivorans]|uniref:helix-turn-helix domain-containing protein n=1 Tax=Fictibacillus phosphorivorans TaxID=1221500 RepID=UPI00203DC957|nr:helix-turn-helix transcriptional regulator [Fictibacillus phosphorivorans]MCM3718109.1 helix-turn-helix domain-containing protein [Fictibacillus phosphorivorans]MCM3775736.1 helix-turn-helix domain-containing protein [Fictibacillus phosphorivorans]
MDNIAAGKLIKELRLSKKITLNKFASKVKISTSSLSRIENGNQEMSFTQLIIICEELGISVSEFIKKLEKTNHLFYDLLSMDNISNESVLDIDSRLQKMIDELQAEQKKALFLFLLSIKK